MVTGQYTRGRALHCRTKKKRTSDGWEVPSKRGLRLWATQSFRRWSIATARLVAFHRAQEHQKQYRTRCVPFTEHCMPSTPFIERRQSCNGKAAMRTKSSTMNAGLGSMWAKCIIICKMNTQKLHVAHRNPMKRKFFHVFSSKVLASNGRDSCT